MIVLLALIMEMDVLHGFMTVSDLTSGQWLVYAAVGSAILWVGELVKIVLRPGEAGRPKIVLVPWPPGIAGRVAERVLRRTG